MGKEIASAVESEGTDRDLQVGEEEVPLQARERAGSSSPQSLLQL